jgi:hypothetical protein
MNESCVKTKSVLPLALAFIVSQATKFTNAGPPRTPRLFLEPPLAGKWIISCFLLVAVSHLFECDYHLQLDGRTMDLVQAVSLGETRQTNSYHRHMIKDCE